MQEIGHSYQTTVCTFRNCRHKQIFECIPVSVVCEWVGVGGFGCGYVECLCVCVCLCSPADSARRTDSSHTRTMGHFSKVNQTNKRKRSGYREEWVNRIPITLTNRRDTRTQTTRETFLFVCVACLGNKSKHTTNETIKHGQMGFVHTITGSGSLFGKSYINQKTIGTK